MNKFDFKNWGAVVLLFISVFFVNFENKALAQVVHTGTIWIIPNRPDAFPVNGNRTGNAGLNLAFEDFHVIEYAFLDSIYITELLYKQPIYQIRLQEEYADEEYEFAKVLHYCYPGFFKNSSLPYYNPFMGEQQTLSTDNGLIILMFIDEYFDYTLVPKSNTRSYNKHMNLILRKYDIKSYIYTPYFVNSGDTLLRTIEIVCQYQDLLPLYYDLLLISYLYDYIGASGVLGFTPTSDIQCGQYSTLSNETVPSLKVFPNPAQDEVFISGVISESVGVYDVMGKMVVTKFDAEKNKIDIKHLPDGLYILKIITDEGKVFTEKILKQ